MHQGMCTTCSLCAIWSVSGLCAPCVQTWSATEALRFIEEAKAEMAGQRKRSADLKAGMDIFNIPQPHLKELSQNERVSLQPCPSWLTQRLSSMHVSQATHALLSLQIGRAVLQHAAQYAVHDQLEPMFCDPSRYQLISSGQSEFGNVRNSP